MTDPKQQILNFIVEQLERISVGTGYSTDISRVFPGKIIQTDKFNISDQRALCQVRFVTQTNEHSGQVAFNATATYLIMVSMTNATHEQFVGFLGDIEAVLAKSLHMDLFSNVFEVLDYYISSVSLVNTTEYDEVTDSLSPEVREQIAECELIVVYKYIPELLSGS